MEVFEMNEPIRTQVSLWGRVKAYGIALNEGLDGSSGYIFDVLASHERRIADLERQLEELGQSTEESQRD